MNTDHSQHGGVLVEYAIAAAILVPMFLVVGLILQQSIQSRGLASARTVEQMTPINPYLSALRQNANEEDTTYLDEHGLPGGSDSD